jgi:intein-encoded DNA endonuclease-like protein
MFVNKNLLPDYFFNEQNQSIFKILRLPYVSNNLYNLVIHNANVAALGKYSKFFFKVPSHNICPYVKKDYHDTVYNSQFTNNFNATIRNRYRTAYDVSRFLIANHL